MQSTDFSKKIAFLPISLGLWQKPQASHVQLGLQTREIQSTRNACSFLLPVMGHNTEQTCLGIKTYHEASGEAPKSKKIQKNMAKMCILGSRFCTSCTENRYVDLTDPKTLLVDVTRHHLWPNYQVWSRYTYKRPRNYKKTSKKSHFCLSH